MIRHVSKVVLYDSRGFLIMQQRDHGAAAKNPGKLSFFGGGVEEGETGRVAALRELREETNVIAAERDLDFLYSRYVWDGNELIRVHYYRLGFPVAASTLEVYEGSGYVLLDSNQPWRESELTPIASRFLRKLSVLGATRKYLKIIKVAR